MFSPRLGTKLAHIPQVIGSSKVATSSVSTCGPILGNVEFNINNNHLISLVRSARNETRSSLASENLLVTVDSKTALPSSWNTSNRYASHARPMTGIFAGSLMKSVSLSTDLTRKQQIRTYVSETVMHPNADKVIKSGVIPAELRGALKAPKEGYNPTANAEEFLQKVLKPQGKEGNYDKRQFAYFMLSSSRFIYATGIRLIVLRFLYSLSASADVLAVSKIEVDISAIPRGKTVTLTWRGKPVFVRHRTEAEIEIANNVDLKELRDPQTDAERTVDQNWSVLLAICTHLGCVPVTDAGAYNAFFCPCHGSHYDVSGRIRKGPAPLNLEVPKHQFTEGGSTLVLG